MHNTTNDSKFNSIEKSPFIPEDHLDFHTAEYYAYSSSICVLIIIPVILGLLVLYVAYRFPRVRTVTNVFVFNLAAVSLLNGIVGLAYSLAFIGFTATGHMPSLSFCRVVLFFALYHIAATMWASVAIGADRYDVLTNPLNRKINHHRAYAISAATWLLPVVICTPGVIGWGRIEYARDIGAVQCYIDPARSFSFLVFWSICALIAPTIMIVLCYFFLIRVIWKKSLTRRALMYVEPLAGNAATAYRQLNETEAQAFRISFIIILSNIILIAPFAILLLLKLDVDATGVAQAHIAVIILLDINIALNSFLYTFGVRSIRLQISALCGCNGQNARKRLSVLSSTSAKSSVVRKSFSEHVNVNSHTHAVV
jgi:hypothetical protein